MWYTRSQNAWSLSEQFGNALYTGPLAASGNAVYVTGYYTNDLTNAAMYALATTYLPAWAAASLTPTSSWPSTPMRAVAPASTG